MENNTFDSTVAHKHFAPLLFNTVWEFMGRADLTPDECDEMIHAAHASRYHWTQIGEPVNLVRGDWQVSRMYTVAGRYTEALYWAEKSMQRCLAEKIGDFDLAYVYEAMARALAHLDRKDEAKLWVEKMNEAALNISESEDREWFHNDAASLDNLL